MAAPDSTKLQVNFKLADGTLINIYATTQAELEANLQSISDLAQLILATGGDLGKGANVAYATKALGGTVVAEPVWAAKSAPAAPAGSVPTCVHGPMKHVPGGVSKKTGKPYDAFYSCVSSDRDNQCKTKSA